MRLLIACPCCHRQYDATGRPAGERFRCRCGELVTISQPQGHDAAVVRCASCGAPRREGSSQCSFCGADFTLREQDLDTICPHCLARIGDRAKFCDHCGNPLAAEPLSIEETALICPVCGAGHRLNSRLVGGSSVLECSSCTGIWVGTETFRQLIRQAGQEGQTADHRDPPPVSDHCAAVGSQTHGQHAYIPCPVCHALMIRQNFGHRSRVIVDICNPHGIWFDAEKLSCILDWVRSGGLAVANEESLAKATRDARIEERLIRERLADSPVSAHDYHERDHDVLSRAIDLLGSIFGR
ncbi:MAG TPA: zinc ribbon domain-containing protein [Pirellulales bacterium]|jgi:Zn-finger nucleic acid-binding protein|nr:zinc ribbon domain-containing protein [Pirellulales bacterium]